MYITEIIKKTNDIMGIQIFVDKRVAVIIFDIDYFKHVNDSYGQNIGLGDSIGHWGGKEFFMVLPNTTK